MSNSILICVFLIYSIFIIIDTFVIQPKIVIEMNNKSGEKSGIANTLLGIVGIIGGAWITAKLIENHSKKVVKYSCPNCSSDIDYLQGNCKVCDVKLKWNF